ncbi:fimbrial protein [Bacteroides sp.]|uniref:fimbrial protein n=1 Tax=Bacteroides sp. TaxID=29523 RepID=UPI002FCBAB8A
MKQFKIFAMAFAALAMFSCSKESDVTVPGSNEPGEKAQLTINVTGEGNLKPASKATGAAATTDVTVNNYIVFLFRDGGALDCPPQHSTAATAMTITTGTTAAKTAYVVANTGVLASGPFKDVKTESQLKAVVGDLMSATDTASQTSTNLWMAGTGTISYGISTDANKGTVTVALGFVAAKIELIVKDNRTSMTSGTISIVDNAVVLLFAGKDGKFFETKANQATQTAFYSGDRNYTDPKTATSSTALSDAVTTAFNANAGGTVFNHFYTFGNTSTTTPTILAIKSTKTVNGTAGTIYYPMQFTAGDAGANGTGIEPGNFYTVTFTLNGDVAGGGGGGTLDPEEPVVSSDITVTVTAAKWAPITIDKEFN